MLTSDSWESCFLSHCSSAGIAGLSRHHSEFRGPLLDGSDHDREFICCSDLFVTRHNMLCVLFCERVRFHHCERKTGDYVLSPGIRPYPALTQPYRGELVQRGQAFLASWEPKPTVACLHNKPARCIPSHSPPSGHCAGFAQLSQGKNFPPSGVFSEERSRTWRNCFPVPNFA